jgi:serine/threonine-protein kinase
VVAIKVLKANEADDAEMVTRFQREGEIATRLVSRNVARVHQYGRAPGGTLFIAMDRLDGSDLAAILRRLSRLEPDRVQGMVRDVCNGIAEAHRLGIIHRDIKPHNIFLARESDNTEVWKVLDFGVSKLSATFGTITRGGVVGTPQYMSPEQARGEDVDVRTDVYGIGAVLYRALTGRPPMPGKGPAALYNAAHRRPKRPTLLAPDISRDIEAVLALALAPNPKDRFQNVDSLRTSFDHAVAGQLSADILHKAKAITWGQAST